MSDTEDILTYTQRARYLAERIDPGTLPDELQPTLRRLKEALATAATAAQDVKRADVRVRE